MQQSRVTLAAILVVLTVTGATLTAFATDQHTPTAAANPDREGADPALTDRVETLLRSDIGLAGSRLRVLVRDGVVTVRGKVPDEHAMRRALDLASGLRGVREVRNGMEIGVPN